MERDQACSFMMPEKALLLGTGNFAHGGYELVRPRIRDFMFDEDVERAYLSAIIGGLDHSIGHPNCIRVRPE
jgi:hypothetical protein